MNRNKGVLIFGPTAVGKTSFAAKLAGEFRGEIISADSRQVYRGMDIGTGKDYDDYRVNGETIPYHLIDIVEPFDEYNLVRFIEDYNNAFVKIAERGKIPFIVGGTMLYVHAILKRYKLKKVDFTSKDFSDLNNFSDEELKKTLLSLNPELHNTTDLTNRERTIKAIIVASESLGEEIFPIESELLSICLLPKRELIYSGIEKRLDFRLHNGMIEEVEKLLKKGLTYEKLNFFGLEYRFIGDYLAGKLNYNDMRQKLLSSIKKFAKRQITWIRKIEREGYPVVFFDSPDYDKAKKIIAEFLNDCD